MISCNSSKVYGWRSPSYTGSASFSHLTRVAFSLPFAKTNTVILASSRLNQIAKHWRGARGRQSDDNHRATQSKAPRPPDPETRTPVARLRRSHEAQSTHQAGRCGVQPSTAEARGRRDPCVRSRVECGDGRCSASRCLGQPAGRERHPGSAPKRGMATSLSGRLPAEIQPQLVQHAAAWNLFSSMPQKTPMREQGENLLPLSVVKARVGMGKTKIYQEIKVGAFPKHIKNGRTSVWIGYGAPIAGTFKWRTTRQCTRSWHKNGQFLRLVVLHYIEQTGRKHTIDYKDEPDDIPGMDGIGGKDLLDLLEEAMADGTVTQGSPAMELP